MPRLVHLDPSPYTADRGPIGILLIHGYTGSVAETRPMGEYLADRGLTVHCPLLAGHGTRPENLTRIGWRVWAQEVESAWMDLRERCEVGFVGGLSLGGLLALWLGTRHPEIAGLIPMAAAIRTRNRLLPLTVLLRHVLKYDPMGSGGDQDVGDSAAWQRIWSYEKLPLWGAAEVYLLQRRVRRRLSAIRQPVLIFQGVQDAQVPPLAARQLYDAVASQDRSLVWLENSGHNLLADGQRQEVWAQSYAWLCERTGRAGHIGGDSGD